MSHQQLLDIQRLDVEADQLRHRRATMPAREQLDAARGERALVQADIDVVAASRVEVATRQRRFEDEAQIVEAKADHDNTRLYGGEITAMKDLQALQDEIAGLRTRQVALEDHALEAMEEAEAMVSQITELEAGAQDNDAHIGSLEDEITIAEAEIDGRLAEVATEREAAVAELDSSGLDEYERLRPTFGAATVVRFEAGNCVGCPSTMPAVEADRMKHAEAGSVLSCDECGRIVLR